MRKINVGKIGNKGFSKLWLIAIVPILIALFVFQDFFAPPGKSQFFHKMPFVSQSNPGVAPNYPKSNYKNSFSLNWLPVV